MVAVPECPCVVTIVAPACDDAVWIRLVGAVEMDAEVALNAAIDRVQNLAPRTVLINLAGVTFAGSVLVHFLVRVHAAAPGALICLHQANPMVRFLVTVTGVDQFVTLDDRRSPRLA